MRYTKVIFCALWAGICLSGNAADKKTSRKKARKEAPVEAVVDTVCIDTFSYAYGMANTQGLKQYLTDRMGVDTAYMDAFLQGFYTSAMTQADKREKARLAGIEIRQQVETMVYPAASKQVNDSADLLNKALFVQGFGDGIAEQHQTLSMDSTQKLVKKQMDYYHKTNMERKFGANRRAGEEFLKQNAKKDSVQTTASGLQYKILTAGTGEVPTATQKVQVHYEGKLLDGKVFDSSYKRGKPLSVTCGQVIKGWSEALTMMPVGSKWELFIPQELAYGDKEQKEIPPYSVLIFTVELLSVEK